RRYRLMDLEEACYTYLQARETNPLDRSVKYLLTFPELILRYRSRPSDYWAVYQLGRICELENRIPEAVAFYNNLANLRYGPDAPQESQDLLRKYQQMGWSRLEEIYKNAGREEQARHAAEEVEKLSQTLSSPK
ncbi:MAG: hypothetical protein V2A74_04650, partial [bacterium]